MTLLGSEHSILIRSKFRSVLQLRLQQRRTREQLADQGIMPHLVSDGSSLEAQMRLKRARLAEDLNEMLALRPGPLELVQKNIIPLDSAVTMTVNHGKFPKQEDSYAFEEDSSSESLSPEQHHSDESQGSACPSSEAVGSTPSSSSSPALTSTRQGGTSRDPPDQSQDEGLSGVNNSQTTPPIPVPAIVKSKTSDKNRHKKPKDVKPKVKKLKYHQYIPPDQKAEKSPPPMDSAYARLLQQQQLFLQLQILSQQKHAHTHSQSQHSQQHAHTPQTPAQVQAQQRQPTFSYQPHPPAQTHKGSSEQISACSSSVPSCTANSNSSSPVKNTYANQSNISPVKPGPLPANLDDLKVSELRQHLRIRGMPVSGTKTALIERLRPFKDSNAGSSPSGSSDITTVTFPVTPTGSLSSYQSPSSSSALSQGGYYPYPSTSSTPPISPASSELSLSGSLPDSFSDVPMSSPPQFALQPSPAQLSMEDGLGGPRAGEGGSMDGLEAEKDKMLVEKQKVIEELTWKLHQEQRQVEELKMQLHKRKRCYGATQDTIPSQSQSHHPSMHHQQTPAMMGQHFFGVTIKQEPMSLSSSCPLSSPKQLKSPPGSCMEDMGHCNASLSTMGGHGGPQCMDTAPSSGSPSTMSAFLSPQCSPQDSPIGKTSSSPQPSSPNNPYLLSPPLGRDGCGHPQPNRARSMQMQQKSGGQPLNCSYPSDQRGLQGVFPNSADCGLNHNGSAKAENPNMQPKQLTRSQQMDELLDVLIESGGCPSLLVPRFHRYYEHLSPTQLPYDHAANHIADSHLETLLGSPIGRGGEVTLLKMATEEGGQEDEGNRDSEGYGSPHNHHRHPHHPQQDKLLTNRDLMDTPLSPISKVSAVPEVQGMVSMTFSETPWETMEWLDLTPPSSATAFSVAPPSGPSIFNTEFLDVTDINLNSAMDLHLEHW
ncbi:myocardin isoform X7 [Scomber scombrus]|uniref:Myocardin n=1 Tax=Scomber scombrus TaxID=13677 RepID=A0AAV1PG41_SCOSC